MAEEKWPPLVASFQSNATRREDFVLKSTVLDGTPASGKNEGRSRVQTWSRRLLTRALAQCGRSYTSQRPVIRPGRETVVQILQQHGAECQTLRNRRDQDGEAKHGGAPSLPPNPPPPCGSPPSVAKQRRRSWKSIKARAASEHLARGWSSAAALFPLRFFLFLR